MKRTGLMFGMLILIASGLDVVFPETPRDAAPLKRGENLLERAAAARAAAAPTVEAAAPRIALEAVPAALTTTRCYAREPGSRDWREVSCAD